MLTDKWCADGNDDGIDLSDGPDDLEDSESQWWMDLFLLFRIVLYLGYSAGFAAASMW
jgi:hypothetical protein